MGNLTKKELHTFKLKGDQTVSTATQLMMRLPNGWNLISFEYSRWDKGWTALVESTEVVVP